MFRENIEITNAAAQATFLYERMQGITKPLHPSEHELEEWEAYVRLGGEREAFNKRLALDGLEYGDALPLTGRQAFVEGLPFPPWVTAFEDLPGLFPCERKPAADAFSAAVQPFADYGLAKLSANASVCPSTLADLHTNLLGMMQFISRAVYRVEYDAWLLANNPAALFVCPDDFLYEYTDMLLQGGWTDLLLKYPVLTRQLYTLAEQWSVNTEYMLAAICESRIQSLLRPNAGNLAHIYTSLGDRHNHGRQVAVLEFENGQKLVYKPRSPAVDAAFICFLDWLERSGYKHSFKTPKLVSGADYGLFEFVENAPMESADDFPLFFKRMGELAAVLYIFGGSDFHYENVIACGEYPVLIDIETLLTHKARRFRGGKPTGDDYAAEIAKESITAIGFFPCWNKEKKNIGAMYLCDGGKNSPCYDGEKRSVEGFEGSFKTGFECMYRHLLSCKEELLSDTSPLELFNEAELRFLTRDTQTYGDLLVSMHKPDCLKSGFLYSAQAERLTPAFLLYADGKTLKDVWSVYKGEYAALIRMDIPYFYSDAESIFIKSGSGQASAEYFALSAIEHAKQKCANLSEDDLVNQLALADAAFSMAKGEPRENITAFLSHPPDCDPLSDTQLLEEAMSVYNKIMSSALGDRDKSWLVIKGGDAMTIGKMPLFLYEGKLGLCIFFAALYHATGEPDIGREAMEISESVINALRDIPYSGLPLGLSDGIGGIILALDLAGSYLGGDVFKETISLLTQALPESIPSDKSLDVISGAAGLSIAAHRRYERTNDARYAEILSLCARHILRYQSISAPDGAWRIYPLPALGGISHGASGMALALARGYRGEPEVLDGVLKAVAFEKTLYHSDKRNWRDLRSGTEQEQVYTGGWCNGAPGIGLARLGMLPVCDNAVIRSDIENAIAHTLLPYEGAVHLCCGTAGRADFLLEAAVKLQQPDLLTNARIIMSRVAYRNRYEGGYVLGTRQIGDNVSPSMFQGLAGVGYELLRCLSPETYESVLA